MKRFIQVALTVVIAIVLVWLLFRGIRWADLLESVRTINILWLFVLQIPIWLSFFLRILRWRYIVRAVTPSTFRHMFSATQLGFLINFTVGLRLGEVVRALVLSRLSRVPFAKSLALAALDRVSDLVGLLSVMLVAAIAFRPDKDITVPPGTFGIQKPPSIPAAAVQTAGISAAILLVVLLGALVALYLNKQLVMRVIDGTVGHISQRLSRWLSHIAGQFAEGLHVFRSAGDLAKSTVFSLLTWACFVFALQCYIEAFHLTAPWYSPFVLEAILAVGVSVPGAPGLGLLVNFSYPIVAALLILVPGISLADATAFALIAYVTNLLPVVILGVVCLQMEGLSFVELSRESVRAEKG